MDKTKEKVKVFKQFYIEKSMELQGKPEYKKALQSIAITVLYLENNSDEKHVFRDARNMLYDMQKKLEDKLGKQLIKRAVKYLK